VRGVTRALNIRGPFPYGLSGPAKMNRHSTVSPLGSLLDELREERIYNPAPLRRARSREIAPRPSRRRAHRSPSFFWSPAS